MGYRVRMSVGKIGLGVDTYAVGGHGRPRAAVCVVLMRAAAVPGV